MYKINDIFSESYPPEVSIWCNENGAYISEIEPKDGVRQFKIKAIPEPTPEDILAIKKSERELAVNSIVVTVDGINFDGDETSQARMARLLTGAQALGAPMSQTTQWMSADNTLETVTFAQLAQALALAGEKQTELWFMPYQ